MRAAPIRRPFSSAQRVTQFRKGRLYEEVMSIRTGLRDMIGKYPVLDALFRRAIWSRIHFPEIEQRFLNALPPGAIDIAIDVGAALGPYSWVLNRKARRVYAFEPGYEHGRYLEKAIWGTRVTLVRRAVGDTFSKVRMYTGGKDTNALHSATLSASNPVAAQRDVVTREVEQVTLDGYFANILDEKDRVDLLKVDVEGYEGAVFRGAARMLERHLPLIICEIEARHDPSYATTFAFLRERGYQSFIYSGGRYCIFEGNNLKDLQTAKSLEKRLSGKYDATENDYINNFVFQHSSSRLKFV